MPSTPRTIVVIVGIAVLVTVTGCSQSSAHNVRRVELVSAPGETGPAGSDVSEAGSNAAGNAAGSAAGANASGDNASGENPSGDSTQGAQSIAAQRSETTTSTSPSAAQLASLLGDGVLPADERFVTELEAALAHHDLCGVWTTLESVSLTANDPDRLAMQMQLITGVMSLARDLVPSDLSAEWNQVASEYDTVSSYLMANDLQRAAAAFGDDDLAAAELDIVEWVTANCG